MRDHPPNIGTATRGIDPGRGPNMTLYHASGLTRDLLELFAYRDDVLDEQPVTQQGKDEQTDTLQAVNQAIVELTRTAALKQADQIGAVLKEKRKRFEGLKEEVARLREQARIEEETYEWVRAQVAEVLASTVEPEVIAAAHQNQVLLRIPSLCKLKLCKSPPAVVVDEPTLLPECYQRIIVKIDLDLWEDMKLCLQTEHYERLAKDVRAMINAAVSYDVEIVKVAIAARLRERVPCGICLQSMGRRIDGPGPCPECGGTGQVLATVPGAHLAEYNTYVVVK